MSVRQAQPILHFDLLVHSSTGSVSGLCMITQAVAPPNNLIQINNITGTVRELVFGGTVTLVVALQGTYFKPGPPGTNFIILENFAAHFSVDQQWDGAGSFDYGNGSQVVNNVPVDKFERRPGLRFTRCMGWSSTVPSRAVTSCG